MDEQSVDVDGGTCAQLKLSYNSRGVAEFVFIVCRLGMLDWAPQ
jgi:hypothetical protein